MEIKINPYILGIIVGNQLAAIVLFFFNLLIGKGILVASAVYGLTTLTVVYSILIIYAIYKIIKLDWRNKNE